MNDQQANHAGDPHWDSHNALARVNDDVQLLREIVGIFLERMLVLRSQIESALREKDSEMLVMSSHTLKGSAGNMVANPTMEIAQRLEALASKDDFASIGPVWEELQQETTLLQQTMSRWLADGTDDATSHQG
jgi:HPt (histidine-containing phosphotransfer) domain-containing protein